MGSQPGACGAQGLCVRQRPSRPRGSMENPWKWRCPQPILKGAWVGLRGGFWAGRLMPPNRRKWDSCAGPAHTTNGAPKAKCQPLLTPAAWLLPSTQPCILGLTRPPFPASPNPAAQVPSFQYALLQASHQLASSHGCCTAHLKSILANHLPIKEHTPLPTFQSQRCQLLPVLPSHPQGLPMVNLSPLAAAPTPPVPPRLTPVDSGIAPSRSLPWSHQANTYPPPASPQPPLSSPLLETLPNCKLRPYSTAQPGRWVLLPAWKFVYSVFQAVRNIFLPSTHTCTHTPQTSFMPQYVSLLPEMA